MADGPGVASWKLSPKSLASFVALLALYYVTTDWLSTFQGGHGRAYKESADRNSNGWDTQVRKQPSPARHGMKDSERYHASANAMGHQVSQGRHSATHLEQDKLGAIDVFTQNSLSICRIHQVCADESGMILLPEWMRNHEDVLGSKCGIRTDRIHFMTSGLSSFETRNTSLDWIGVGVPIRDLARFTYDPLSLFFTKPSAKFSSLHSLLGVERDCYSSQPSNSRICSQPPQSGIPRPAAVIQARGDDSSLDTEGMNFLQSYFRYEQERRLTIVDLGELREKRVCFRSAVVAPFKSPDRAVPELVVSSPPSIERNVGMRQENVSNIHGVLQRADDVLTKGAETDDRDVVQPDAEAQTFRPSDAQDQDGYSLSSSGAATSPDSASQTDGDSSALFENKDFIAEMFDASAAPELGSPMGQKVCRIYNACLDHESGTVVLPNSAEPAFTKLGSACEGAFSFKFVPQEDFDRSRAGHMVKMDLLGPQETRHPEHTFLVDMFPRISALAAIFKERLSSDPGKSWMCFTSNGEVVKSAECKEHLRVTRAFAPAVLAPQHLRDKPRSTAAKFARGVLRLLPPHPYGPHVLFSEDLSRHGNYQCFNSLVATKHMNQDKNFEPSNASNEATESILGHKLLRGENASESRAVRSGKNGKRHCTISVAILQPRKKHISTASPEAEQNDGRPRGRWPPGIYNERELEEAIENEIDARGERGRLSIDIQTLVHEGSSVPKLLRDVQRAHVVMGVHHPSLTDIVFANPGTLVLEVHPYGYNAGPYSSFARLLSLRYASLQAKPDLESFKACIERAAHQGWPPGTTTDVMDKAVHDLMRDYAGKRRLRLDTPPTHRTQVPEERSCARDQRSFVDSRIASNALVSYAIEHCNRM